MLLLPPARSLSAFLLLKEAAAVVCCALSCCDCVSRQCLTDCIVDRLAFLWRCAHALMLLEQTELGAEGSVNATRRLLRGAWACMALPKPKLPEESSASVAATSAMNDDSQLVRLRSQQAAVLLSDQGHGQDWQPHKSWCLCRPAITKQRRTSQSLQNGRFQSLCCSRRSETQTTYSVSVVSTCVI